MKEWREGERREEEEVGERKRRNMEKLKERYRRKEEGRKGMRKEKKSRQALRAASFSLKDARILKSPPKDK